MTTKKRKQKLAATSRKNARQSTGPRSIVGKAIVKSNGVSHGISSVLPVIRGEKNEDWEAHRLGILESSAPLGPLEVELAERVALLTWRLRRVVRYENQVMDGNLAVADSSARTSEVIHQEHDEAQVKCRNFAALQEGYHQLQTMWEEFTLDGPLAVKLLLHIRKFISRGEDRDYNEVDGKLLSDIGVPLEWHDKLDVWEGWTAGIVMKAIAIDAEKCCLTADELVEKAVRVTEKTLAKYAARTKRLEEELTRLTRTVARRLRERESTREIAPVMDQAAIDKVIRYENHLSKQLVVALELLKRMQAYRFRRSQHESAEGGLPSLGAVTISRV
jgi:hypothetical protein